MIKELNQTVTDYDKNKLEVIDIRYLMNSGADVNILLSVRQTTGKTTSALQYIREEYLKRGKKAVFVASTQDDFIRMKPKFLGANRSIYPKDWEDVKYLASGLYDIKRKETFCFFTTINAYHKFKYGGRDPHINLIIYDEFNGSDSLKGLRANQSNAFENIVRSCTAKVRVFLLGNDVTKDIPIFGDLGIASIKQELQLFYKKRYLGRLRKPNAYSMLIYKPDPITRKTLADFNIKLPPPKSIGDWRDGFSYDLGLYGQSVEGTENIDRTEQVVATEEEQARFTTPATHPRYILFYQLNAEVRIDTVKREFLIVSLRPTDELGDGLVLTFSASHINRPRVLVATPHIAQNWWNLFRISKVFFSDIVVKNRFLEDVVSRHARTNG